MKSDYSIYEKIFTHYIDKANGSILVASPDVSFVAIVKSLFKSSRANIGSLYAINSNASLPRAIARVLTQHEHVIVIVERSIEGRDSLEFLEPLKAKFRARLKIIVISEEVSNNVIALIYEKGADNIIVKPLSQADLTQKISSILSPNNEFEKLVEDCKTELLRRDWRKADALADNILAIRPTSAVGLILKGDVCRQKDEFENAKYFYTKALLSSKFYLEPLKKLVDLFDSCDDTKRKLTYLKRLDALSPLNKERKIEIARSLLTLGDKETAFKYFEQAVKVARREANEILSKTYMDISVSLQAVDEEACLAYNSKAIEVKGTTLNKDDVWMFNEKGIRLRKAQRNQEAIDCFQAALKIAPLDPNINYNLGMAYAEEGEAVDASHCFDICLKYDPDITQTNPKAAYNMGLTYFNARRFDEAHRMFVIANQLDPANEDIASMLANALKRTKGYVDPSEQENAPDEPAAPGAPDAGSDPRL